MSTLLHLGPGCLLLFLTYEPFPKFSSPQHIAFILYPGTLQAISLLLSSTFRPPFTKSSACASGLRPQLLRNPFCRR
ncbi:hypothetical protein FA15DRAFT_670801 [Coprinopsis marcescibilis]|uniref:Uncharacterized protein n=1 Tax=Coprinopsis marcescibilis TaxID=230819 RepID=A0A5C3KRH9_COPMA|nr:hypothetical protein FA15DRAFT_670801 [Coprinopsis marcescibilis]